MSILRYINGSNSTCQYLIDMLVYLLSPVKTKGDHQTGANGCSPDTPLDGMLAVKKLYHKTSGRQGIHLVVSPSAYNRHIEDKVYLRLADRIASLFPDYQSFYVLHKDTARRHIHIVLNTVSFIDGKKFGQSKSELNRFRQRCNEFLDKLGFDAITESANDFWDLRDYSNEKDFDFLEIDESAIPNHRASPTLDIDPNDDPLEIESSGLSLYQNPLDPKYNNYGIGAIDMSNLNSGMNVYPSIFGTPHTQNQPVPSPQEVTTPSVTTPDETHYPCAPDMLSPAFPTMAISTGPKITIHAKNIEAVIPLIKEVSQMANDQSVDAANQSWAMYKKAQEVGFPANTLVNKSPHIEIDLTGQLTDIPIIDTTLSPSE